MFSRRLSLTALIELCRVLRHYLGAGLSLQDVFRQQASRGAAVIRPIAARVDEQIKRGSSFADALEHEKDYFPPLFLSLARVGEQTGMLPEIFADLEAHFVRQKKLRNQFIALSAWPVFQFFAAVFVIAMVILVLGLLGSRDLNNQPWDPIGLGLLGPEGAIKFLCIVFGTLAGLGLLLWALPRIFHGPSVARWLLAIPAVGPCLRDLALGRFCMALRLTTESGMSIVRALRLALEGTGNDAFRAASPLVEETVKAGDEIHEGLALTRLFPDDFIRILAVAEGSGQLDDVLRHQGEHYHESAARRLTFLTVLMGYGVWLMVGVLIIFLIFRLFSSYLGLIDQAANFRL